MGTVTDPAAPPVIRIAAAVVVDAHGRWLLVRKQGTSAYMQVGGKIEPGEEPAAALVREIGEEIAAAVRPEQVRDLGPRDAPAANEPGHRLEAHVFAVDGITSAVPTAEIAEAVWVTPDEARALPLAPLTVDLLRDLAG
ncbi:NUDIX hydrolase [Cellulomonas triticagri]|uniref:NUDIX domain-containing protein n=1 Tax=Cellulomonas triticagri TaxID=2483352 RepID=A0A3M2J3G5_9CELL|nr:NUDIX domain-containing protein [Cellulomonas triticagri]